MHEAHLINDLIHRIEQVARDEKARRVTGVAVWLGALSHMSEEHFIDHFEQAAAGTVAEGARLDITVSDDAGHAHAQDLRLESVEVEA